MFGFAKDRNMVRVAFYEIDAKRPFAKSKVPTDQLPDTFEIETVMEIKGKDWRVVESIPLSKAEFGKSGKLKLVMVPHKVVLMDPDDILYSIPTISEDFAPMVVADNLTDYFVTIEDDWRTIEFVSTQYATEIIEEMEAIKEIYENHRQGVGFSKLHARKKIPAPIPVGTLNLDDLKSHFLAQKNYGGVALNNGGSKVQNGFAFEPASNHLIWGSTDHHGDVFYLHMASFEDSNTPVLADLIDGFLKSNKLYLVDWPRMKMCGEGKLSFAEWDG